MAENNGQPLERELELHINELHAQSTAECLTILKEQPTVWQKMNEAQQLRAITRFENFVEAMIRTVASAALSKSAQNIQFKMPNGFGKSSTDKGIELTITIPWTDDNLAQIGHSMGRDVVLVTADVDSFIGRRSTIQTDVVTDLSIPRTAMTENAPDAQPEPQAAPPTQPETPAPPAEGGEAPRPSVHG